MKTSFIGLLFLVLTAPEGISASSAAPAEPGKNVPAVKIDTVGFPMAWKKKVVSNVAPKKAVLFDVERKKTAWVFPKESWENRGRDAASGDEVWVGDFSSFPTPGRYLVRVGRFQSDVFEISENPYAEVLRKALKMFYFQRCRTVLSAPFAEERGVLFERPAACHTENIWDMQDFPGRKRAWRPQAGWHDAGNYDMYVPSTAPTALALLSAFERAPQLFRDGRTKIPESGNGVPDILDEAAWGIRWVLSLQEKSGAVRHREAVEKWSPEVPPHEDRTPRWIAAVGTASTAKACALFARAARVYAAWDAAFAERCRRAAEHAWRFLQEHPERIPVDAEGSPQPLWDDDPKQTNETGARLIAAVERWRTFREEQALQEIRRLLRDPWTEPEIFLQGAWLNLSRWGLYGLVEDEEAPPDLKKEALGRLSNAAAILREIWKKDGYLCATGVSDYYWGSHSNLMERAELLALVARWTHDAELLEAARDQWHWILGRNPNGFSMVTGVGRSPTALYHLEWGKFSYAVLPPGYLVGGPNAKEMSFLSPAAPAKALLWDNARALSSGAPAHALWHWKQSDLWEGGFIPQGTWNVGWWAVAEPDIYYNANLVLAAATLLSY